MKAFFKLILLQPIYNLLILLVALVPGHSLAVAIITVTVLVRLLLLPSTNRASTAAKKMQDLQPELARIKTEYKDDQTKQASETMALYRRHGINPLGSCLPTLVQFPIIIILFYALRMTTGAVQTNLLYSFVPNPTYVNIGLFGIDMTLPELWILPIAAALLQLIATWQLQRKAPGNEKKQSGAVDTMALMNKQMLFIFPVLIFFTGRRFPAALSLYWVVTTLFTVIQQQIIFKTATITIAHPAGEKITAAGVPTTAVVERKTGRRGVSVTVRQKKP